MKTYDSAYLGSMFERTDGGYLRRDDPQSLAAALLAMIKAGDNAAEMAEEAWAAVKKLETVRDELAAALEYYTTSTQDGKDDGMLARSTIERIFG